MRTIKLLLAAGFLLVLGTSVHAQVQRNETYLLLIWDSKSGWQRKSLLMYPVTIIRGNLATTARSNTGSFNRNCATGSANVSTEASSACTDIMEK